MILKNKNAVIYGAGGSLGGAVAKAFAAAGARVFLTGHNKISLEKIAEQIHNSGGVAELDEVDGFDETTIAEHLDKLIKKTGKLDISFNAVGVDVIQNIPLVDLPVNDYVNPVTTTLRTQFLTATSAGKIMKQQGHGVILSLTATPGGIGYPYTGGFSAACAALESLSKNLASELGAYGVRVVNIRSGGSPDSKVFVNAIMNHPDEMETAIRGMENDTMLKKLPLMADIANVALFLASDMASKITGVSIDVTAGTTAALNYRVDRIKPGLSS